jgi:hypothetical protein
MSKAQDLIAAVSKEAKQENKIDELKREISDLHGVNKLLSQKLEQLAAIGATKVKRLISRPKAKAAKHFTRVIIPDSHGAHIDPIARDAFLADLKSLQPTQIVMLGDHMDCGGTFSAHQVTYTNEMVESYETDVADCNSFLDAICVRAPNAEIHYLEGNHEAHVERWCARNIKTRKDADFFLTKVGPAAVLHLKARGIHYYKSKEFHQGLTVRGSIRLGKCFFTHGVSHAKHADDAHLSAFNSNVVFGHVHRVLEVRSRTVTSSGHGAWSPGTLAKLQPLYRHTEPTTWSLGYGLQFVNEASGRFNHINVPIFSDGTTGLAPLVGSFQ